MQHYHSNRYRSKKFSNQSTSLLLGIIYQESDSQNLFFARKLKTSKHRSSVSILTLVKPPKSPPLPSPQLKQPVPKLLVLLCHNNQCVPQSPPPQTQSQQPVTTAVATKASTLPSSSVILLKTLRH